MALKNEARWLSPGIFEALQVVLVAGSPMSLELCDWFHSVFPKQVAINNGSGGTDMLGCVVGGNKLMPVHVIELAAPALGMNVQIWSTDRRNISSTGQKGEMVNTKPFPNIPVSLWGKQGIERSRKAYFDKYPGVWAHGDYVSTNPETGGHPIHGRSDEVLHPGDVTCPYHSPQGTADDVLQASASEPQSSMQPLAPTFPPSTTV